MLAVFSAFWMVCLILRVGPSLSSCTPSVSVLDLHCHLQWNCPDLNSSTTFTVQTKAQGGEWQNVSECFQISSNTCDVSQAFTDDLLYNFIRLGLNRGHGEIRWTPTQLCELFTNPDARFSPPSVSVSLDGPKLWVDVAFPCAPSVLCQSDEEKEQGDEAAELSCCSITRLLQPNTSVILYNKHDAADTQTYTKEFETSPSRVEFGWLVAGQEYCAVAHFASSPRSEPKCIHVPLQGSLNVAVLCGMLIALLLIAVCFLGRRWASSDTRLPKNLMSLQNVDQESPFVVECGQAALEEEENSIVLLSIVPLYSTSDLSEPGSQSACLCSQSLEDVRRYYASSILQHQAFDEHDGDTGSHLETDGDSPSDQYPGHLWPLDPALRTGQACLREDCLPLGDLGVPLSSVKVAGGQREEMELDHVHEVLMNLKMVNDSQLVSDRDHGE